MLHMTLSPTPAQRASSRRRARLIELLGWLLIIVGLIVVLQRMLAVLSIDSDFNQDYIAAQALRVGQSLYADFAAHPIRPQDHPEHLLFAAPSRDNNFHPPFTAVLFVPFTFLPYSVAMSIWNVLSLAIYLAIGFIIGRELDITLSRSYLILLLGLALCWYPFAAHIALGQISLQLILPIIGCWALLRHGRPLLAGALLGFACLIKLFPGLIVVFLLLIGLRNLLRPLAAAQATARAHPAQTARRLLADSMHEPHIQAAAAAGVVIAAGGLLTLLIVGAADMARYTQEAVPQQLAEYRAFVVNHGLAGPINRLLLDGPWVRPLLEAPLLASLLNTAGRLLVLGIALYQIWRLPATRPGDDIAFSLVFLAMLLISPLTWQHVFPLLALPFGLLLKKLLEEGSTRKLLWYLLPLLLISVPDIEIARNLMLAYEPYRMPWYAGLLLLPPFLGLLLLWRIVWQELAPRARPA